jgi:hypothetical protein
VYLQDIKTFAREIRNLGEHFEWRIACYQWINLLSSKWLLTALSLYLMFYSQSTLLIMGLLCTSIAVAFGNLALFVVTFVCFLDLFLRERCGPVEAAREVVNGWRERRTKTKVKTEGAKEDITETKWEKLKLILSGRFFTDITLWTTTFRDQMEERKQRILARILVTIFLVLNILILAADIWLYQSRPLRSFLVSICLRAILCPIIAYFHPLTPFLYKCEFNLLRYSCFSAVVFVAFLIVTVIVAMLAAPWFLNHRRFSELPPLPENWTNAPDFPAHDMICHARYEGLSVLR